VIKDVPVRGSDPAVWTVVIENVRVKDVLIEQITAMAPELGELGELVGHVSRNELEQINEALRLAFALD
jgi:mRNA-degrading endonuclease toxin of MazEF toxin-antitoxin module